MRSTCSLSLDSWDRKKKNNDRQRRDRILRSFSTQKSGNSLHILGRFPYSISGDKGENPRENIQKIPEVADFCRLSWSNASWGIDRGAGSVPALHTVCAMLFQSPSLSSLDADRHSKGFLQWELKFVPSTYDTLQATSQSFLGMLVPWSSCPCFFGYPSVFFLRMFAIVKYFPPLLGAETCEGDERR